jgi:hypothetical protein
MNASAERLAVHCAEERELEAIMNASETPARRNIRDVAETMGSRVVLNHGVTKWLTSRSTLAGKRVGKA